MLPRGEQRAMLLLSLFLIMGIIARAAVRVIFWLTIHIRLR